MLDQSDNYNLSSNRQPLQSESSSTGMGVQGSGNEPLEESMGNPAEKSHFQKREQAVEELLSKV